mgnify:CR=1 FL=1
MQNIKEPLPTTAFARVAAFSRLIEFRNILQSFKSSLSFPVTKLFLISYKKKIVFE